MKTCTFAVALTFGLALLMAFSGRARAADDKDAVIDKAIKAAGGQEKLAAFKAATWKAKGKINFGGNESEVTSTVTIQGPDHNRQDTEVAGDTPIKVMTVVNGDKAWRKIGDMPQELEGDRLANARRDVYLQLSAANPAFLKDKGFKIEPAGEEKVGDKPAIGLKVTPKDGKEFTIFFDKETGLPSKQVAKVLNFQGEEVTQEVTYQEYKDFSGIKKATKIEVKRGGENFLQQQISEFKVMDKADAEAFTEPK